MDGYDRRAQSLGYSNLAHLEQILLDADILEDQKAIFADYREAVTEPTQRRALSAEHQVVMQAFEANDRETLSPWLTDDGYLTSIGTRVLFEAWTIIDENSQ